MLETQLAAAFNQMLSAEYGIEKFEWWLHFAHANERWVQFELGFWLGKQLGEGYAVGCEQNPDKLNKKKPPVDLVVYDRSPDVFPLWTNTPIANLELKVQGNWYATSDVFRKIKNDRKKIDALPAELPGIALVIWFFMVPNNAAHPYRWLTGQVEDGTGLRTTDDIDSLMEKKLDNSFQKIGSWRSQKPTESFDVHEAHLYYFQNEAARRSPPFANSVPPTANNSVHEN